MQIDPIMEEPKDNTKCRSGTSENIGPGGRAKVTKKNNSQFFDRPNFVFHL